MIATTVITTVVPGPAIVLDANVAAILTALALLVTSISGLIVAIRTRKENAVAIEDGTLEIEINE